MTEKKTIRIGNAGGYWGDDPNALKRQIEKGTLDYITIDFLAEVTMSIMQKQYAKDKNKGYAYDFISMLEPVLPQLIKNKTRLITNAGGINPKACALAIQALAKRLGLEVSIAVVYGDDILENIDALSQKQVTFENMETHQAFDPIRSKVEAANVYFGAWPVAEALKTWKPDIIVTGRVTDTGITLAPMIFEFGWKLNDWDKLASGIIAGHMIECGSQVTGGNFSDWEKVESFDEIGYPIVEVQADGTFVLTKHPHTGGLVSVDTVREQLFYEMGNPHYLTPDVIADFTSIKLQQEGKDRVLVSGIKGYEPTAFYKVSMAYADGYKGIGSILISGPNARKKAEAFAKIFWTRCSTKQFDEFHTEYLGWNACHRSLGHQEDANEILLRLGAKASELEPLNIFRKLIPSLILSGPPGVAVLSEGVPKVQSVVSYWPSLIKKDLVHPTIAFFKENDSEVLEIELAHPIQTSAHGKPNLSYDDSAKQAQIFPSPQNTGTSLYTIALARSGDKGDTVNIGVLARSPQAYRFLKQYLTAQRVKDWFQELCLGEVYRYSLDGLQGLNFLLEKSLGGGGSCTLRTDAQGKTFSQALLRQKVEIAKDILDSCS